MTRVGWGTKLGSVVGGPTAKKLESALGLVTVGDLLSHYPRTLVDRTQTSSVAALVPGELATFSARVRAAHKHPYRDRRTGRTAYRVEVVVDLDDGEVWMTFFARSEHTASWQLGRLTAGRTLLFSGKAERNRFKQGRWELTHPDYDDEDVDRAESGLRPIYQVSAKLTSWTVENAVRVALDVIEDVPDLLPATVRRSAGLLDARTAVRWVHRPDDWQQWGAAAKRLRFDEAFLTQTVLALRRRDARHQQGRPREGREEGLLDRFDQRLPFELTAGQQQVGAEILDDLRAPHPMHRLLQGEVGSGKTVVALRAMLQVVDSGGQAALLAPTEVLAQQHHRSVSTMLGDLAAGGMLGGAEDGTQVALLTGSLSAAARKAALLDAASGAAGIVIGTHALLEERVQFADLGLVVVDEQHRFGVEQRAALSAKAGPSPPHVLVMTATPIPRTVAMTVFGDLEISTLVEVPAGRSVTGTSVVPLQDHPAWLERAWARAREEVDAGRQVYVVCPRIGGEGGPSAPSAEEEAGYGEGDGDDPAEATRRPAAVDEVAPGLAEGPLHGLRVVALHGRLTPERKDEVMRAFAGGEVDVLVSTTVVEVGVDVPNASMMVVLDADRFGVSQLHQLRGRVGRGRHPGLCLLVTGSEAGSPARSRLDAVAATTDGFALSRLDLEQRREGDVLGSSQSGSRRTLRLLSVLRDEEVIVRAREEAAALVEQDPGLDAQPALSAAVGAMLESDRADFLEKA